VKRPRLFAVSALAASIWAMATKASRGSLTLLVRRYGVEVVW
jgi:hypothetical protein